MTTKQALSHSLPPPQAISLEEMNDRALQFAATTLVERLVAVNHSIEDPGVVALVENLQNLMRLFIRPTFKLDLAKGSVTFTRTILKGDWETGAWNVSWEAQDVG